MGRLCIKSTECKNKEYDRRLKEQDINGLDDKYILDKYKRISSLESTSEIGSDQVLIWAQCVEAQKAQK